MIIGTAGHIDHGKTSLVKALTGIDTDRLPEEKRRGITLELGFAHLSFGGGLTAGVVDVPGHERFVKAMAAGAGGVDVALLVVAADEGVMPQTREHLDICQLLGVRTGVIALTKGDLLPGLGEAWRSLLEADLREAVAGTFLEEAELVPCSARTGQGVEELKAALQRAVQRLSERSPEGPAFLPVDRVFTLKGFGTVVTGSLFSGRLAVDDVVSLVPSRVGEARVRGLQQHGRPVREVVAGSRVAVNLAGVEPGALSRGVVLTRAGEVPASRMLDVELTLLPSARAPLPKRSRRSFHLGTQKAQATVALLDRDELAPGETGLAQVRLGVDVAALPQQRFILRGSLALPGRGATVGGGRVLALSFARRRRGAPSLLAPLLHGGPEERVSWQLRQAGYAGLSAEALFARSGLPRKTLLRALDLLSSRGEAALVDRDRRLYLSAQALRAMEGRAVALVDAFHLREPLRLGIPQEELRKRLSEALDARVLSRLLSSLSGSGELEVVPGELWRRPGRERSLSPSEEGLRGRLLDLLAQAGLAPPSVEAIAASVFAPPAQVRALLQVAVAEGRVARVSDELFFHGEVLGSLRDKLVRYLREHRAIETQAFKEMVGQSRKYVIPLSEYFDRERVTLRVGEKRVLRRA